MALNVRLLLAHEMIGIDGQDARQSCEFGQFFSCAAGATPNGLIHAGIYNKVAVALKGGQWRAVSMVLMGQALAEPPLKDRTRRVRAEPEGNEPALRRANNSGLLKLLPSLKLTLERETRLAHKLEVSNSARESGSLSKCQGSKDSPPRVRKISHADRPPPRPSHLLPPRPSLLPPPALPLPSPAGTRADETSVVL